MLQRGSASGRLDRGSAVLAKALAPESLAIAVSEVADAGAGGVVVAAGMAIRTLRVTPPLITIPPAGDDEDFLGVLDVDEFELRVGADLAVDFRFVFEDAAVPRDEPVAFQISIVARNSPLPLASTLRWRSGIRGYGSC